MKIVMIHGFNVKDKGRGSVDRLVAPLMERLPGADFDMDTADYGWHFLLRVRFFYWFGGTINRIAKALENADVVITHSNGANYCMKAVKRIKNLDLHIIHLSPALNATYPYRRRKFNRCDVLHTLYDSAVAASKYLPFHPWGDSGRIGAKTKDSRVENHNFTKHISGHSDWFTLENREMVADYISTLIEAQK